MLFLVRLAVALLDRRVSRFSPWVKPVRVVTSGNGAASASAAAMGGICGGCAFAESTIILLEETFDAPVNGRRVDAFSAPESDDKSLINTISRYSQCEISAETEHRYEEVKKSGLTDEVR